MGEDSFDDAMADALAWDFATCVTNAAAFDPNGASTVTVGTLLDLKKRCQQMQAEDETRRRRVMDSIERYLFGPFSHVVDMRHLFNPGEPR